jgi:hypothetical protein
MSQGDKDAKKIQLKRRKTHKILPRRVGGNVRELNAEILDLDEYDRHALSSVSRFTGLEIYVEWEEM